MSRYVQIIQAETAKSQGAIAEQLSQTISNAHAHHARHARHARHASSDAFLLHIKCTGRHQTKLVVILHGRKKKKMSRQGVECPLESGVLGTLYQICMLRWIF